ncbi:MAG: LamG domain-containing protein [Acidobacteriaceae bacterium]
MNTALRPLWLWGSIVALGFTAAATLQAQTRTDPQHHSAADIVWSFDEAGDSLVHDSAGNRNDPVQGLWRRVPGVEGTALELDGYTTHIVRSAAAVPRLGNAFTVSAWIALNNYPWNWVPIVDQSDGQEVGYFFGIDAFGHVGLQASIDGVWQRVTTERTIPLKKWTHLTGTWDGASGLTILINGEPAADLNLSGQFWQDTRADLLVGRVRTPQLPFPAWLSHPEDPVMYSLDGDLDDLEILNHAVSAAQDRAEVAAAHAPAGNVIPYAVLPAGPPQPGPFGAMMATLHYQPAWDRLRRIGPDSDVIVRFARSAMRLVFWQGTNYIPAWVTENGKWYTDEFLETWGHGCPGAGDCEPMSDKQSRYSRVSIVASSPARAIVHWRYALAEARNYEGAHADPLTGWFDWADEYWTVYPDGVAVRKQVLWSSGIGRNPFEWQETIVINGPGQRPEDNIQPDALTLENMDGQAVTYRWEPKTGNSFSFPKGPATLDRPPNANIQIVHLKSRQNPFQIVWPRGISHDTYNDEQSYSMFEWWNHWPVAQVGSSGRPAVAADRASHTSLSHIYWDPWGKTANTETKLLLCGLTTEPPAGLLPLAKSWLNPPTAQIESGDVKNIEYDPAQRAFVVHRTAAAPATMVLAIDASSTRPLVNPAFVIENWPESARVSVTVNGRKSVTSPRLGTEHHLEGDSLIVYLPVMETQPVQIRIEPVAR